MIAAFLAGLASFLSPCVLPLVPGYVSLISGASVEELQNNKDSKLMNTVLLHSLMFILGFSVVFISLGAAASWVGQLLHEYKRPLTWVAGALVILFGLHLTGILKIKWLYADKRLHQVKGGQSPVGAFVLGFAFAFSADLPGHRPLPGFLSPVSQWHALGGSRQRRGADRHWRAALDRTLYLAGQPAWVPESLYIVRISP